jgi:hypothetical protein
MRSPRPCQPWPLGRAGRRVLRASATLGRSSIASQRGGADAAHLFLEHNAVGPGQPRSIPLWNHPGNELQALLWRHLERTHRLRRGAAAQPGGDGTATRAGTLTARAGRPVLVGQPPHTGARRSCCAASTSA